MNEHSGKAAGKRRGPRDEKDENIQFCPRIGCSGRLNYSRVGCVTKPYSPRQHLNSSNGKEVVPSSSRTTGKSQREYHGKSSSRVKTYPMEARTSRDEPVVQEQTESSSANETEFLQESRNTVPKTSTVLEVGCSSGLSAVKSQQKYCNKSRRVNQNNSRATTVSSPSTNTRSVTDVPPHSAQSRFLRKRGSEGESSSSSAGNRMSGRALHNNRGVLISKSRNSRSWWPSEDNNHAVSARMRSSSSSSINSRSRTYDQNNRNNSTHTQPSRLISQLPRPRTPNAHMLNSTYQFSTDNSSDESSSYSVTGDAGNNIPILPFPSAELGMGQSNNRNALWRYSMDEIAGVLLQLERIEQDEDMRYEQLLTLGTNVFLNGLSFYDQHRDMRLDIDNMSYEELLALGDRMGTVSTAVSEEAMAKCLRRSIYQVISLEACVAGLKGDEDDNKCSICQEEYTLGDEVGTLECEHRYHLACIHRWLSMKNWCPICKAPAVPSRPSSPP